MWGTTWDLNLFQDRPDWMALLIIGTFWSTDFFCSDKQISSSNYHTIAFRIKKFFGIGVWKANLYVLIAIPLSKTWNTYLTIAPYCNHFYTGFALKNWVTSLPSYHQRKLNPQQLFYMTPGRVNLMKLYSNIIYWWVIFNNVFLIGQL